ncbi:MAG: POTRA domain-containing protein [Bacteroidales bacterium]|nr:POTRA domain-containing protein [Bacteroidales bacterium]
MILLSGFWSLGVDLMGQPDSTCIIGKITFEGNKITKDHIIARELMVFTGDTLGMLELSSKLDKSRENLLNTSLFNFVSYDIRLDQDRAGIVFNFVERWYIWPWPVIEFADRNFNAWWTENRSLSRMSYGVMLKWGNFRGRREEFDLTTVFGYNERYGIDYKIPYLNRDETIGLGFGIYYGRTHEVPVLNKDDKLVYYDDNEEYIQQEISSYLSFILRKKIYNTHTLRLEYNFRDFDDTLTRINPAFSPGGEDRLQYLSVVYQYKSDHRDDKPYPLRGYYFDIELAKRGFGVLENGGMDVFYVLTTFRKYMQLGRRWYFASGLNSKFSNESEQPFFMNRAIGYGRDIVRGYEYYVVNGYNFGILKNNIKFALLPRRNFNIKFIKSEKFAKVHYAFYLNAFFDMGFVDNFHPDPSLNNGLENTLLIGYGLGIDFVTYYDLVLRMEYSVNRMNEHGFFLHFMAPI